jgi:hypothetical protein
VLASSDFADPLSVGFMVIFAVDTGRRRMGFKREAIANVRYAVDAEVPLRRLRRADRRPRSQQRAGPRHRGTQIAFFSSSCSRLLDGAPAERLAGAPHPVHDDRKFTRDSDFRFAHSNALGEADSPGL